MKNVTTRLSALFFASALVVGCSSSHPDDAPAKVHGEQFTEDTAPKSIGYVTQAQAASGAKKDGMLYDYHFSGSELNSLGQTKLNLILHATHVGETVTVCLNTEHDDARAASVAKFFKNAGVPEKELQIVDGPNANDVTPTAYNLSGIYHAEGGSFTGETGDTAGAAAPAAK